MNILMISLLPLKFKYYCNENDKKQSSKKIYSFFYNLKYNKRKTILLSLKL